MENELIATKEVCVHYQIEHGFIQSLEDAGLIEVTWQSEQQYIHAEQLQELERLIRLHYELQINLEGIEAISHLLARVRSLQQQITSLEQKLHLYAPQNETANHPE
jgi:chaperone modulatory protein CbpM